MIVGRTFIIAMSVAMAGALIGGAVPAQAAEISVPGLAKIKRLIKKEKVKNYKNQTGEKQDSGNEEGETNKKKNKKFPKKINNPREIEEAAEFASEKTGVRKDFLMGMLTVESDLGRKTGECTYKEVREGAEEAHKNGELSQRAWNTFEERKRVINDIAEDLGYDVDQLKVSCNPTNYAGTGGALGVPQFMPDIWMIYKDEIASITGKKNPDPWDARDGVVAMALLLGDTAGVTEHNYYAERNAAKMYLSGTTSEIYGWYADQAFYWSRNYKRLMG